jgi:replication initiation and membrane attachment protein DnaB
MTDTELLEQIINRLDRIEEMLENGIQNNKTLEIKETRQLMQDIVKNYKDNVPPLDIQIGTKLHIFRFREAIAKVKNIKNNRLENRRLMKFIRKLEEYEFIRRDSAEMVEVLDLGIDWGQLQ